MESTSISSLLIEPDFRLLFEAIPSPYLVLAPDFTIVAVNDAYLQATRTTRHDLLGHNVLDVVANDPIASAGVAMADLRASLLRVLGTKERDTMTMRKAQTPVSGPDGMTFEERYWRTVNSPVLDAKGELTHIIHRMEDVTEFGPPHERSAQGQAVPCEQATETRGSNAMLRETREDVARYAGARLQDAQQEREYFLSLLMAVPIPISVLYGPEHRYRFENNAHRKLTCYRDVIGKSYREAFPDALEPVLPILDRIYQTGQPVHINRQRIVYDIQPDGAQAEAYLALSWHPLFGADGKVEGVITATMDITEQVVTEQKLRSSEERYRTLFESIDEGFCIVDVIFDQDGTPVDYRFCEINSAFEKHAGLNGVVGKTAREAEPQHEAYWIETYGHVAKTGEPIRFEKESRALNRWFDVYAFRLDESDGSKVAILFKDITDRKRIEEERRNSEALALEAAQQAEAERCRLDAVLEAAPVGIIMANANGTLFKANRENRRLWGENQPLPKNGIDFSAWKGWWADGSERHGQQVAPHEWPLARALNGEDAPHRIIEVESFDPPFVRRTVLASGAPIRDGDGSVTGGVVAIMDITDRICAEQALKQADRRKDEFLAMLAHELRNPLAPIAAAADLLRLGSHDERRVTHASDVISRQVKHMTGLVDDLLDVSRVTRGLITLDKTRLDAKEIVADAIEQVRPLIQARGHHLATHLPPHPAWVLGDRKRLVEILANLLSNAAKYTPGGGELMLAIDVEGDYVNLSVTDNGIGMAPELVTRVFDLFTQAERTADRSQGGLGIGLALVKSLVELHDGSVEAFSEGPGKGSRFTVCLPHLREADGETGVGRDTASNAGSGQALRVMIVDDNVDAAEVLAMLVETMGHQVYVEHRSGAALEQARAVMPHVCLLDIGLPEMDGNELARRMRAQPETAGAILVAVTGYGQERDRAKALGAGFNDHLVKPVDINKLSRLLSEVGKS